MKITQISVFLENRKGRLYGVCSLLGKNRINIRALTIAETQDFGILRMVVDKPEETLKILKKSGFVVHLTDIVAVEVEDKPGGLAGILKILFDNNLNVEYVYGFLEKFSDNALLVMRFEEPDRAIEILKKKKIRVVGKEEITDL
ncbi:MAG: ACT domain-containing protein [Candidatus Omnitrophica bacterium]|nr:ACT domain-containing protein [Candidatus Omnitrophota bacterium]MDD5237492.1 ACT domain-containing protein [Candidatus Omnitrophota bacterium]